MLYLYLVFGSNGLKYVKKNLQVIGEWGSNGVAICLLITPVFPLFCLIAKPAHGCSVKCFTSLEQNNTNIITEN